MPQQDELWQADITYLEYNGKDVNQLTFIDVYSRFVVFANKELLNEMEESDDFKELEMITLNACQYYNSNRYHKSFVVVKIKSDIPIIDTLVSPGGYQCIANT